MLVECRREWLSHTAWPWPVVYSLNTMREAENALNNFTGSRQRTGSKKRQDAGNREVMTTTTVSKRM